MTTSATAIKVAGLAGLAGLSYLAFKTAKKRKSSRVGANASGNGSADREYKFDPTNKDVLGISLDTEEYIKLLGELMSFSEYLQNAPPKKIPQEELAADVIVRYLRPFSDLEGGPLKLRKYTYVGGRSNLIITYPGSTDKMVSFVGSHLDVVAAERSEWKRDPFKLTVEGDRLHGRGVTDCLGHVALIAQIFKQLAQVKPDLKVGVCAVFIANEESSAALGVGIDELAKRGELEPLKTGPVYWVDSANFGPTLGTGGSMSWSITAKGKAFHSGFPNKAINAIELAYEAVKYIEKRFYQDFPLKAEERDLYKFQMGSSMKATQISTPFGSGNLIPGSCTISGDIRSTPTNTADQIRAKVEQYVRELNVAQLETVGYSNFELPEENLKGRIELEWMGHANRGLAVDLNSVGFQAICAAVAHVRGECKTFSLTGSLPIIADLKEQGFDVQVTGFGRMDAYHAIDEYSQLSEMVQGSQIIARIIATLNDIL